MFRFLKNETITYESYRARFIGGLLATIVLWILYTLNIPSFNFALALILLILNVLSIIFTVYNLYRAILAGLGVYDLKGLLTVFKKLIEKI